MLEKKYICCLLSLLVLALTITMVVKASKKAEPYTLLYPFHPINPMTVQPWDAASVYSLPDNAFQLGQCNYSSNQAPCAWKTLGIVEAQDNLAKSLNLQFEANDAGREGQLGAAYWLAQAELDPTLWSFL